MSQRSRSRGRSQSEARDTEDKSQSKRSRSPAYPESQSLDSDGDTRSFRDKERRKSRDGSRSRSRDRDKHSRSRDRDRTHSRSRGRIHGRSRERKRSRSRDKERDKSRDRSNNRERDYQDRDRDRRREKGSDSDRYRDKERHRDDWCVARDTERDRDSRSLSRKRNRSPSFGSSGPSAVKTRIELPTVEKKQVFDSVVLKQIPVTFRTKQQTEKFPLGRFTLSREHHTGPGLGAVKSALRLALNPAMAERNVDVFDIFVDVLENGQPQIGLETTWDQFRDAMLAGDENVSLSGELLFALFVCGCSLLVFIRILIVSFAVAVQIRATTFKDDPPAVQSPRFSKPKEKPSTGVLFVLCNVRLSIKFTPLFLSGGSSSNGGSSGSSSTSSSSVEPMVDAAAAGRGNEAVVAIDVTAQWQTFQMVNTMLARMQQTLNRTMRMKAMNRMARTALMASLDLNEDEGDE